MPASGGNPCGCPEGIASCAEVYDCMVTHICPGQGLYIDEGSECIGIRVGSCLGFDGSGRLVYTCGEEPEPGPCQRTWETIDEFFVGGRGGGAANLVGWASPQAIDYALANNVPLIECHAFALVDNVAAWSPMDKDAALDYITTNPGTTALNGRSSAEWISYTSDPGTPDNFTGRNSRSPAVRREPDGGYHGYGLPQFSLMLAVDALRRIDGRALVNLDAASGDTPTSADDVAACIQAINTACAQQWAMITISPESMDLAQQVTAAGIKACIGINEKTGYTTGQVIASTATWVRLEGWRADATMTTWVDAGMEGVLVRTNSRMIETERLEGLGVTGLVCNDPVYADGRLPAGGFLSFYGKGTQSGTLDYWSDEGQIVNAMGYTRTDEAGLWVYNAEWISDDVDYSSLIQHELSGLIRSSVATPQAYTVVFDMQAQWNTRPSTSLARGGLIFGQTTDADMSGITVNSLYGPRYADLRDGYIAYMHIGSTNSGQMVIGRFDGPTYTELARSGTNVTVPQGSWMTFTLTVTATGIQWERAGGASVQVDDATYRGPFLGVATWNSIEAPGTWETGFRNIDPTWPAAALALPTAAAPVAVSQARVDTDSGERVGRRGWEPDGR